MKFLEYVNDYGITVAVPYNKIESVMFTYANVRKKRVDHPRKNFFRRIIGLKPIRSHYVKICFEKPEIEISTVGGQQIYFLCDSNKEVYKTYQELVSNIKICC